jgi:hypothetical protein
VSLRFCIWAMLINRGAVLASKVQAVGRKLTGSLGN